MIWFLWAIDGVAPEFRMSSAKFSPQDQWPGRFWAYIVGHGPNDSQSNRLHVDIIFQFFFHLFEVYSSIYSSKLIGNSPEVSNFNRFISYIAQDSQQKKFHGKRI